MTAPLWWYQNLTSMGMMGMLDQAMLGIAFGQSWAWCTGCSLLAKQPLQGSHVSGFGAKLIGRYCRPIRLGGRAALWRPISWQVDIPVYCKEWWWKCNYVFSFFFLFFSIFLFSLMYLNLQSFMATFSVAGKAKQRLQAVVAWMSAACMHVK